MTTTGLTKEVRKMTERPNRRVLEALPDLGTLSEDELEDLSRTLAGARSWL